MKYFLLTTAVFVAVSALPYELVEDEEGQLYQLIPRERSKRQTTNWQIQSPGIGTLSHSGTILNNDIHRLDGTGYAAKDFRTGGIVPDAYGGRLDYAHKPTGSVLGLEADHVRGGGTGVRASGTYNLIHTKNADVGITGEYGRHFGGPSGTGRADYGGRLDYAHKPSGSVLGLGVNHVRGEGTGVKASGTYNFIHTKNADVGITGEYGRHFGGPGGTGKPNYGVFLGGKVKF